MGLAHLLSSSPAKAGAHLTISGDTGYFNRSGAQNYDGWWVGLRAKYEP